MRVRGLKRLHPIANVNRIGSHPMRVRGLKQKQAFQMRVVERRTPCGCVD